MKAPNILTETPHYVGLCDQLNSRIVIRDLGISDWTDDRSVIWEYRHDNQGRENFGWIAGLKFRHSDYYGGDVMLFCVPRCKAYIVSMETKEILLTATDTGCNPHSSELLPNGIFIVGSSNDGTVTVYAPGETKPCFSVSLTGDDQGGPDVHGVLWDPKYNLLWIEGGEKLRSFRVEGPITSPFLTLEKEYNTPAGATYMHDMAPLYGDPDCLLVAPVGGILKFEKRTETFSYDYPCSETAKTLGCGTGIGLFEDGVLPFVSAGKSGAVYQYWNTDTVYVCVPNQEKGTELLEYKAPTDAYYKLRIFDTRYQ